jgi:hypothetical protein
MSKANSQFFEDRVCPKCGGVAKHKLGAPSILTSTTSANQSIDVVIGRDANARWDDIHRRQELREKVRTESKTQGLSFVGRNEFQPLSDTKKTIRTDANKRLQTKGYESLSESDARLIKR